LFTFLYWLVLICLIRQISFTQKFLLEPFYAI